MMERAVKSIQTDNTVKAKHQARDGEDSRLAVSVFPNAGVIQRKAGCACGGGCPDCQAKSRNLPISHPNDASEIEADAMADKVMRMSLSEPATSSAKIRRKKAENAGHRHFEESSKNLSYTAPAAVSDVLNSSGKPLDEDTRAFMEPRFNRSFADVKIHDNVSAAESADSINALAYTSGNNIVFNAGQYNANSDSGKRLLAHELTHVAQQTNLIQPYRDPKDKKSINYGVADDDDLIESNFNMRKHKRTKPWIELITVVFDSTTKNGDGVEFWKGTGKVHYYTHPKNKVQLDDFELSLAGAPVDHGETKAGDHWVHRIEGKGYMSSKYSDPYEPVSKKGYGKKYSKDLRGNMNYAVFFHKSQALHSGPVDDHSHGCVHIGDRGKMKQVNYHSVLGHTKVVVKYE